MQTLKHRLSLAPTGLRVSSLGDTKRIRGTTLQNIRKAHFEKYPLCVRCLVVGRTRLATELDHIVSLQSGGEESRDPFRNRQGLCREHHEQKSQEELGRTYEVK